MALSSSNGGFGNGVALRIASGERRAAAANSVLVLRRRQPGLSLQRSLVLVHCVKPQQQKKSQSDALADGDVSASRDSMEDTVSTSAGEVMDKWVGKVSDSKQEGSSETSQKNDPSDERVSASRESLEGVVGASEAGEVLGTFLKDEEAKPRTEEKVDNQEEIDDIEKQYLYRDKLDSSAGESETKQSNAASTIIGNGSSGRDWRVCASGDGKSRNDEQDRTEEIAAKLGCLEELVMQKDNGRSASDYNRRAGIFEKSNEVFSAKKKQEEMTASSCD